MAALVVVLLLALLGTWALEQYAEMTAEGLDAFTPEDRHQAYKALRLRVTAHPHGGMEVSGVISSTSSVVYDQGTMNVST